MSALGITPETAWNVEVRLQRLMLDLLELKPVPYGLVVLLAQYADEAKWLVPAKIDTHTETTDGVSGQ